MTTEIGRKKRISIVYDEPNITLTFRKILKGNAFKEQVGIYDQSLLARQNFKAGIYCSLSIDV